MSMMPHHENDEFDRIQARIDLRTRQRQAAANPHTKEYFYKAGADIDTGLERIRARDHHRQARIAKLQLIQHELDEMNAKKEYRAKILLDGVVLGAVMALFVAGAILFTLA